MSGKHDYEVAVIGAGVAGVAAACAAADFGASVILIERCGVLGGVASLAGVGTICGLFLRDEKEFRWGCSAFVREFVQNSFTQKLKAERARDGIIFLPYQIPEMHHALDRVLECRAVTLLLHSTAIAAASYEEDSESVDLQLLTWNEQHSLRVGSIVDATGEGGVSSLLNLPVDTIGKSQAHSLTALVRGLPIDCDERLLNVIIAKASLDSSFSARGSVAVLPGSKRADLGLIKFTMKEQLNRNESLARSAAEMTMRRSLSGAIAQLKRISSQCASLEILWEAPQTGFRTGIRPIGIEPLLDEHVLHARKPMNGVAVGSWPIEQWREAGRAEFSHFAYNDYYLIPDGALQSKVRQNLFYAGRGIAADEQAIASARVIGTAMGSGYAAGALAAARSKKVEKESVISQIRQTQFCGVGSPF